MAKIRTNIILGDTDQWAISVIREYTGIAHRAAIIRDTLRERARAIEREKAAVRKRDIVTRKERMPPHDNMLAGLPTEREHEG